MTEPTAESTGTAVYADPNYMRRMRILTGETRSTRLDLRVIAWLLVDCPDIELARKLITNILGEDTTNDILYLYLQGKVIKEGSGVPITPSRHHVKQFLTEHNYIPEPSIEQVTS
jgi:hypothetical protein